jgi:hypothetical protein
MTTWNFGEIVIVIMKPPSILIAYNGNISISQRYVKALLTFDFTVERNGWSALRPSPSP